MKELNDALIEKLLYMARLELSQKAREEVKEELKKMTKWFQKLREIDTDGVLPLMTMTREVNRLREDLPEVPLSVEQTLGNAPERSSHYFKVPVVHNEE